jgi:hypothetical protein
VVCPIGVVSAVAVAVGLPTSADSLKSVVPTLNAIVNPEDACRLEYQARHHDRPSEEHYWRNYGAGLEQQRRERGEAMLSTPNSASIIGPGTPASTRARYEARQDTGGDREAEPSAGFPSQMHARRPGRSLAVIEAH